MKYLRRLAYTGAHRRPRLPWWRNPYAVPYHAAASWPESGPGARPAGDGLWLDPVDEHAEAAVALFDDPETRLAAALTEDTVPVAVIERTLQQITDHIHQQPLSSLPREDHR